MNEERRKKLGLTPKFNALKPGQQVQVDLKNATPLICECGCKYFKQAFLAYKVSAFASPTGQELTAQQPVFLCMECGKMLGEKDA